MRPNIECYLTRRGSIYLHKHTHIRTHISHTYIDILTRISLFARTKNMNAITLNHIIINLCPWLRDICYGIYAVEYQMLLQEKCASETKHFAPPEAMDAPCLVTRHGIRWAIFGAILSVTGVTNTTDYNFQWPLCCKPTISHGII